MDHYKNYMDLAVNESYIEDYIIESSIIPTSNMLVFTPHGGGIELGTTELVRAIVGKLISYYCFNGRKKTGNSKLHITSINFDEKKLLNILQSVDSSVSIHGCKGKKETVFLGGLDERLIENIKESLYTYGFDVGTSDKFLGINPNNITNKNRKGMGAQIEVPYALRKKMFGDIREEKDRGTKTDVFWNFVYAIQDSIDPIFFDDSKIILNV